MKKLVSIFLCIVLALPTTYINVSAEEDYKFYAIDIDAGNGVTREQAIVQNGEIFIPATRFSRYTRFTYDTEDKMFLIKGQEFNKAFKYVVVDIEKKRILVSGTNFYELSDCIDVQGEIYLPLCQMLPVLNADIHEVKDNVIYISNNKLSLAEVLYDFDISKYYFNMAAEFNNMDWAALFTIVPSYVWDTVVDIRFDRLDILYNYGEYNDYKDIFSEFLSDDNLYLKAMAKEPSLINSTIDFFDKTNNASKDMKTVYGWIEAAGETDISLEKGGQLLEALKEYYDSGELEIDEFKGLNDAWAEGTISFGDYIEILNYVYTYVTQVQDNREMLNAVYDVNSKISKKETARKAAKQVYDLYGEKIEPALFKEVTSILINDVLEELSPIGIYTATIKVAKLVIERFMPFNPSLVARIPAYSDVVLTSATKYLMADTKTDESTEDLRLSALLCMIASKKCFEIMSDVFEENAIYYQSNIEKIEQIIMGLYIAEENTEFDSFEHFEEYGEKNLNLIKPILDNLVIYNEMIAEVPSGVYYCSDDGHERDEFRIHSINENEVEFSVTWFRCNSIDNAKVKILGTKGNFSWKKSDGEYVAGQIEFIDEKTIILTLEECTLHEVETKGYKYEYFGSEDEESIAYNEMVLLNFQTDSCGWSRTRYINEEFGVEKEVFIRFNSDGSIIYWLGETSGGDTIYTKYLGKYKITKDMLYIDDCSYILYAYTAGSTTMTLEAEGNYEIDLSGEYFCEDNEIFQFLYSDK